MEETQSHNGSSIEEERGARKDASKAQCQLCPNCSSSISPDMVFCSRCGTKLKGNQSCKVTSFQVSETSTIEVSLVEWKKEICKVLPEDSHARRMIESESDSISKDEALVLFPRYSKMISDELKHRSS